MQSEFQNKVVLPKKAQSRFHNFLDQSIFSSTFIIRTFINLDNGSLPINPN
jgi:hypothetical protein